MEAAAAMAGDPNVPRHSIQTEEGAHKQQEPFKLSSILCEF